MSTVNWGKMLDVYILLFVQMDSYFDLTFPLYTLFFRLIIYYDSVHGTRHVVRALSFYSHQVIDFVSILKTLVCIV